MLSFEKKILSDKFEIRLPNIEDMLKEADEIVNRYNNIKYIDILLNFWVENPPTLGHSLMHALFVAINAYKLGELNNYSEPEHLFVGGLFHDVHREAEGRDGEESQVVSVEIINKLFNSYDVSPALAYKVISAVSSHDAWRGEENPPKYDMLFSFADKSAMNTALTYGYLWASNKNAEINGEEPSYKSHLDGLAGFAIYQKRAWSIFRKFRKKVNGSEYSIKAYIDTFNEASLYYLADKDDIDFESMLKQIAKANYEGEVVLLKHFGRTDEDIKKITSRFYIN